MNGSKEQIKWAEDIKKNFNLMNYFGKDTLLDIAINFINAIDDAEWWIDHREYSAQALCKRLLHGTRIGSKVYTLSKDGEISKI